jgi:hypothetical protein
MKCGMMKKSEQEWDHYSGLPSPLAYQRRELEKKLEREYDDDDSQDDDREYNPGKRTYSDSLEDEE